MESGEDNGKDTTASSYECGKRSGATKVVNDSNGTARQRQQQQQLKQSPNPWALERIEQMERLECMRGAAGHMGDVDVQRGRTKFERSSRAPAT
ncbi:GD14698 [Drosophila simulans]|uniref:GD14698 n=1 Tax=Drosophila simulans TaxID=7240 RepID=B4QNG0_DROSI|nr:GD14698 [Drosophila simulans]